MNKAHIWAFWGREAKEVKRVSFFASMKEIVKMCNQAPNADIFISLMPKAEFFIYSE